MQLNSYSISQQQNLECSLLTGRRIIFVLPGLKMGGAERQALLLARYLVRQEQADVQIWGFDGPGEVSEICDEYQIPWRVIRMGWPRDTLVCIKAIMKFGIELRKAAPDIVLPFTIRPNVYCGLTWRWSGAKTCIWNQGDEGLSMGVQLRTQYIAARLTPWFASNSDRGMQFLSMSLSVPQARIRQARNGIELPAPQMNRVEWRKRLGIKARSCVACMVANLHDNKDHTTLIQAWRIFLEQLKTNNYSAHLLLAGRHDNMYKPLVKMVSDFALEHSVHFLGSVKDIAGLLQASDLVVFSSRSEGIPNGVLEGMAAGLAVVGTDIPGIREAVGPSNYAFLAPPANASVLADRINEMATNTPLREKVGAMNRLRIEQEFSPQQMVNAMTSLIARGLESTKRTFFHHRKDLKQPDERMACVDGSFGLSQSRS